ncbi:3-methyl-2-oxobutanoate hydroxymethyltransferase [Halotalea alkalilenta]|uniref:3-methyl-2-oxobutanoate hydroxymethyltransferase n=1 Tax=Halotalea alkalilenta TaxID=376489 RepID=UPI00048983CE|nr:3-methyl-2-oxobutanoate hydroxymethyltransferase [Halotalea alkalilenta]
MPAVTLSTLTGRRESNTPFSCLTAYDATFARLASDAGVEVLLIGDSLGMVLQGHSSTLPVTITDIAYHTACVARAGVDSLIMADLPFMADVSIERLLDNAGILMRAGAQMVKIEGEAWLAEGVEALSRRGVPVCVHLGLTPQHVNALGGYRIQGRDPESAQRIIDDALALEQAGAAVVLLECVPSDLALEVRDALTVPVIGIGAGPDVDGQILVMHDMLGASLGRVPRFVKNFLIGEASIQEAFAAYHEAVVSREFPAEEHCF